MAAAGVLGVGGLRLGLVLLLAKGWNLLCSFVSFPLRVGDGTSSGVLFRSLDSFLVIVDRWLSSNASLLLFLCELVLRPGSCGGGCFSSMAEAGGTGVNSMWPITAVLSPSISGSSTMFGVRQSFWIGLLGGCKIWGIGRQSQRLRCRSVRRRFLLQHCDDDGRCAPFAGCLAAEIAGGLGGCWWSSLRQDPRTVLSNLMFPRVLYAFSYLWWRGGVDFFVNLPSSRVPDVRIVVF